MCGIICAISEHDDFNLTLEAKRLLEQRGPDDLQQVTVRLSFPEKPSPGMLYITFVASVLSLRSDQLVKQPLSDPASGSILCWNGEAWQINGNRVHGNDTESVFKLLLRASAQSVDPQAAHLALIGAFERIQGPYAFVFLDKTHARLYFGRDRLGRRSLLKNSTTQGTVLLASVAERNSFTEWFEVEADGIYVIDLHDALISQAPKQFNLTHVPYLPQGSCTESLHMVSPFPDVNTALPTGVRAVLDSRQIATSRLESALTDSLTMRARHIHSPLHVPRTAKVAVLYSGGLDCTLLTRLAHELLSPHETIDLLNVAFQNPRIHRGISTSPYELCPDRITARASYNELLQTCPARKFRLVLINIPCEETLAHRQTIIDLIYPHNTEMDFSIACALYFAARGIGVDASTGEQYSSTARVLLSGLGADELFGGYQRHAIAFARNGYSGLLDELQLDFSRLGKRNLGRDDRVISHWGKEARYPYLDENLVSLALKLPVWEKCGFGDNAGERQTTEEDGSNADLHPGKLILRLLAVKLGLEGVAREKKRAIQFGARTAKMEAGSTKGTQLLS